MQETTRNSPSPALPDAFGSARIAVLVPCYNESATVSSVIRDFQAHLPSAQIYVYDNASTDDTAFIARAAGAQVRHEPLRGKGNVVRRMLADVDADIYVLVDGDGTYDAASAPAAIQRLLDEQLDMVNCARVPVAESAFRPGHASGNRILSGIVKWIFGDRIRDMLSGYRIMSRRFVKSFPAFSAGFEIETELTVHALELRIPLAEIPTPYSERPEGSASKLNTISDGARILKLIFHLVKEERPLQFFSWTFIVLAALAVLLGLPIIHTFLQIGLVPRMPTAILATGLAILAFLALTCGLILDTVTRGRRETKRLFYLSQVPR